MPKRYSKEFKEEALKLAAEIGPTKAYRQLDLPKNTLLSWKRAAHIMKEESPLKCPVIEVHYNEDGKALSDILKEMLQVVIMNSEGDYSNNDLRK